MSTLETKKNNDSLASKYYYKIGEVSEILEVKPHVIRYWEKEFPSVRPVKTKSHHRLFRREDIAFLKQVKELLYNKKFTVSGARKYLKTDTNKKNSDNQSMRTISYTEHCRILESQKMKFQQILLDLRQKVRQFEQNILVEP